MERERWHESSEIARHSKTKRRGTGKAVKANDMMNKCFVGTDQSDKALLNVVLSKK